MRGLVNLYVHFIIVTLWFRHISLSKGEGLHRRLAYLRVTDIVLTLRVGSFFRGDVLAGRSGIGGMRLVLIGNPRREVKFLWLRLGRKVRVGG